MSVDTLTDSELRSKLSEYGYPVGPVTQTTRKILIKKLKNLMETRGAAGSRHSLAARYVYLFFPKKSLYNLTILSAMINEPNPVPSHGFHRASDLF